MLSQILNKGKNLVSGLLGAFVAYMLCGFGIWFISVSPVFLPMSYFLNFFPGSFFIGIAAGFLSQMLFWRNKVWSAFLIGFVCASVGEFVASTITATSDILPNPKTENVYYMALQVSSGLVTIGLFAGIIWLRRKGENLE